MTSDKVVITHGTLMTLQENVVLCMKIVDDGV
jgi:hypothetical protein